jgi:hypothetical protein
MFLPLEQLCGSRLKYKLVHAVVRVASLVSILLIFIISMGMLSNAGFENLIVFWFWYWPIAVVSVVVFESFWLGRSELEMRALAIDWLFALAYLAVWCFEIVKMWAPPVVQH